MQWALAVLDFDGAVGGPDGDLAGASRQLDGAIARPEV